MNIGTYEVLNGVYEFFTIKGENIMFSEARKKYGNANILIAHGNLVYVVDKIITEEEFFDHILSQDNMFGYRLMLGKRTVYLGYVLNESFMPCSIKEVSNLRSNKIIRFKPHKIYAVKAEFVNANGETTDGCIYCSNRICDGCTPKYRLGVRMNSDNPEEYKVVETFNTYEEATNRLRQVNTYFDLSELLKGNSKIIDPYKLYDSKSAHMVLHEAEYIVLD